MSIQNSSSGGGLPSRLMREHISKLFPACPLCGSREPLWKIKYRVDLTDGRIQFRCAACSSAFSITQTDLTGVYKLKESKNFLTHLYTWQLTAGDTVVKKLKGKDPSTPYIKIDEPGYVDAPFRKGQEVPVEELQKYADSIR